MEEKKKMKVSISTILLIIAVVVIGVMGFFIYKFYNEKVEETKKAADLQEQVNSLNGTVNELQGKINSIADTINPNKANENTNNSTSNSTNNVSFTEEQVKKAISDYLELYANANCGIPLDTLKEKGKINYDSSKSTINPNNGEVTTNVKFSDYKKAMLNYVTESEFEKNWTSKIHLKEDSNGYFVHGQLGGALIGYTVNSINKINDSTYGSKVTAMLEHDTSTKTNEEYTFTVKSYNGNCVINSMNSNN